MAAQPGIYLLCGEDEFTQDEFVSGLTARLGDSSMADLNTTRLDGRTHSIEDLVQAASAMPFLAALRLVIFAHPTDRIKHPAQQKKLTDFLDRLAPTTQLVLTEDRLLTEDFNRKKGRIHWLEKWVTTAKDRAVYKEFRLPAGAMLISWIQKRAEKAGGRIAPQAATELAAQVGAEPRQLDQEIGKLLAYVNYARPIEVDDVLHLTPFTARVPDFALVNAIRSRDAKQAYHLLHRELEEKDPLMIFGSITHQFRQVMLAREWFERGGQNSDELAGILHISPYPAKLALEHARGYSLAELERIYHILLKVDSDVKSSEATSELALDLLMLELTDSSR